MTDHKIEPTDGTLHGTFSKDYAPILTIDPGDSVRYRTLDARWLVEPPASASDGGKVFPQRVEGRDDGHALCGPVAIRGAKPGMTLAVRINHIVPGSWGWSEAWYGPLGGIRGKDTLVWTLDKSRMIARNQFGHSVALRPFMGVLGMPPAEDGVHSTIPPRVTGGNLDCKELVPGSTLYLPVAVEGGLFSVGDGHAAQGDGEVSGTAIECPMDVVDLTFDLREDLSIKTPHADTPAGLITFGLHENLDQAASIAMHAMLDLIVDRFGVNRLHALALASVAVDLRVTQIVNDTRGIHAVLPHGAIR